MTYPCSLETRAKRMLLLGCGISIAGYGGYARGIVHELSRLIYHWGPDHFLINYKDDSVSMITAGETFAAHHPQPGKGRFLARGYSRRVFVYK